MNLFQLVERRSPVVVEPRGSASVARDRLQTLFSHERGAAASFNAAKTHQVSLRALTPVQAACLRAIRCGKVARTPIAVAAGLSLRRAADALNALCELGLIRRDPHGRGWALTELGQSGPMQVPELVPGTNDAPAQNPVQVGVMGRRLLELLNRPRCGREIIAELNISQHRLRALTVALIAMGKVRVGDPDRVTLVVARSDDTSVLLTYHGARVLSSFPLLDETTPSLVAADLRMPISDATQHVSSLREQGLVRELGQSGRGVHYELTPLGSAHPQYRAEAKKARPVPLVVKSERARLVLSRLSQHGPAQTHDLREALHIPRESAKALMQHLKRKGLVRKSAASVSAPFELTELGLMTEQAMTRRFRDGTSSRTAVASSAGG